MAEAVRLPILALQIDVSSFKVNGNSTLVATGGVRQLLSTVLLCNELDCA